MEWLTEFYEVSDTPNYGMKGILAYGVTHQYMEWMTQSVYGIPVYTGTDTPCYGFKHKSKGKSDTPMNEVSDPQVYWKAHQYTAGMADQYVEFSSV